MEPQQAFVAALNRSKLQLIPAFIGVDCACERVKPLPNRIGRRILLHTEQLTVLGSGYGTISGLHFLLLPSLLLLLLLLVPLNDLSGTADELHGWANVMRDSIDACDNKTITEKWKMKILVELGADVFDRSKHSLFPGWKNATDTFIATVKPHVASGKALGVFMGDEICCGGTPYSNLSSVAARLKAGLPDAWICKLAYKTNSTLRA